MLAKGNPLPSTRSLAQRWQVARGTVEAAFDRLRMEGYVTRKAGSGTVVSAMVPDKLIAAETPSTTWRQYRQQPPATPLATARPPSSSKAKHQDKSTSLHSVSRLNGSPRENTGQKKKGIRTTQRYISRHNGEIRHPLHCTSSGPFPFQD